MQKKLPIKWIVAVGVIALAAAVISQLNFGDSLVYFYTPKEATAKAAELNGKTIKVGGMVKPGTVDWRPQDVALDFTLTDLQGVDINVSHKGVKPDMFKEGQGVVVEGKINAEGNRMLAYKLMVKHSEEYKAPHDAQSMNKELLEKSLFKNQE